MAKNLKRKPFPNVAAIVLAGLLVVAVTLLAFLMFVIGNEKSDDTPIPAPTATVTEVSKVEKSLSGKTSDEDRKDALVAVQEILTLAADDMGTGLTPEARAEKIEDGDMSVLNLELEGKIRLIDVYTEESLKNNVFQALIAVTKHVAVDGVVLPVSENAWQVVYVDPEVGIAYVPISVFHNSGAPFSLEMIYIDGSWKLSPYSFMDIVRLSSSLQDN